jgi:hypothetical protein
MDQYLFSYLALNLISSKQTAATLLTKKTQTHSSRNQGQNQAVKEVSKILDFSELYHSGNHF